MILETIILAIFILSLGGVLFILARKISVLKALPHHGTTGIKKHHIILKTENKIKDIFVYFHKQIYLHKFLSWVKIMTLKIETRIDKMLHKIRKRAQEMDKDIKDKK